MRSALASVLALLPATAAAVCPPPDPGVPRHRVAVLPASRAPSADPRDVAAAEEAVARALACTPGFEPSPATSRRARVELAKAGPRCAAEPSCALDLPALASADRVLRIRISPVEERVAIDLSLHRPGDPVAIGRIARSAARAEVGERSAELAGRLLSGRDPLTEAWRAARTEDERAAFLETYPASRQAASLTAASLPAAPALSAARAILPPAPPPGGSTRAPAAPPAPTTAEPRARAIELYRGGLARLAAGDARGAEELFSRALDTHPDVGVQAAIARGHARLAEGRTASAAADYRRALITDATQPAPLLGLAECARADGDVREARRLYEAFLAHPRAGDSADAVLRARDRLQQLTHASEWD